MSFVTLAPGTIFGKDFRILRPLSAGGMGAVFIAEQLSTGKQRALKVLDPKLAQSPSMRERFVLEARAASAIDSDHVVEVVTAGVDEETQTPFVVMELLRGQDLQDTLRNGPLRLEEVGLLFKQLGHALALAHAANIVHRDIKPANIFLCTPRSDATVPFVVKILDFGVAKVLADGRHTTQGLGTPTFMAPEQAEQRSRVTPATDVWALGLVSFTCLTGKLFWRGEGLTELMREMLFEPIPRATARAAQLGVHAPLPDGFDEWFARCVARQPEQRFAEAGQATREFVQLLDAARVSAPSWPEPRSAPTEAAMTSPRPTEAQPLIAPLPVAMSGPRRPNGARPSRSTMAAVGVAAGILAIGTIGFLVFSSGSNLRNASSASAQKSVSDSASLSSTGATAKLPSASPSATPALPAIDPNAAIAAVFSGSWDGATESEPPSNSWKLQVTFETLTMNQRCGSAVAFSTGWRCPGTVTCRSLVADAKKLETTIHWSAGCAPEVQYDFVAADVPADKLSFVARWPDQLQRGTNIVLKPAGSAKGSIRRKPQTNSDPALPSPPTNPTVIGAQPNPPNHPIPDVPPELPAPPPPAAPADGHADSDRDGIPDSMDQCPTVPEDHDGVEDSDGCPDQ